MERPRGGGGVGVGGFTPSDERENESVSQKCNASKKQVKSCSRKNRLDQKSPRHRRTRILTFFAMAGAGAAVLALFFSSLKIGRSA